MEVMNVKIIGDMDRVYLSESADLECLGIMCFVKSEGSVGGSLVNVFANFEILKGNGLFYFVVTRGSIGGDNDEVRVRRLNSEAYVRDVYLEESSKAEAEGYTKVEVVTILPHCSMVARKFVSVVNALDGSTADAVVKQTKSKVEPSRVSVSDVKSGLSRQVETLVKRLYWEQNEAIKAVLRADSFNADVTSALGMLSLDTIQAARLELRKLVLLLNDPKTPLDAIAYISNRYNTLVPRVLDPHGDAWLFNSLDKVAEQFEFLDVMEFTLGSAFSSRSSTASGVSAAYANLNTDVVPVRVNSHEFRLIADKMKEEQMATHKLASEPVAIYRLNQKAAPAFNGDAGNVVSLWHGTKAMNLVSILSGGLRLPANLGKNVARTGSMFGYGCYFGCYSKALQYSTARFDTKGKAKGNTSFVFLADVCLGKPCYTVTPCSISKAPTGYNSLFAVGRESLKEGTFIRGIEPTKDLSVSANVLKKVVGHSSPLLYDEFIVYNLSRIKLRYLVEVKTGG